MMHANAPPQTTLDLLALQHDARGSAPAILAPGREAISYAELFAGIDRAGDVLAALGFGRGHRIATAFADGPDAALAMLAAMTWATCAPLNRHLDRDTSTALFAQLRIDALIAAEGDDSLVTEAARAARLPLLRLSAAAGPGADLFALNAESARAPVARTQPRPDDVALVTHTSGTTAVPKVVPITHRALLGTGRQIAIDAGDRCLCHAPLHTTSGLGNALVAPLKAGASTVLTPGFDAARFFDWLAAFKPTYLSASPTVHAAIIDEFRRRRPPLPTSLRFVRSSSSGMSASLQQTLESVLQVPVIQGYGSTEAGLIAQDSPLAGKRRAGSVGTVVGAEIMILGEDGAALAAGAVGEILVRGPTVMAGYENDPGANRLAFHEGWYRTGDLGYLDADGYLFITGRAKDIINRGGLKVSPGEVDAMFSGHPAVEDAATVGIVHPSLGEDVVTAVIRRPGASISAQQLREYALQNITPFKVPTSIVFVGEFPRNSLGKVLRRELATSIREQLRAEYVPPRDAEEGLIAGIFAQLLRLPRVGALDNFFLLGGDSLRAARALARIGAQTGVEIEPRALFDAPTVEQFAQQLRTALGASPASAADAPRLTLRARRAVGAPAAATPRSGLSEA
jgi:acyl-CoA synthetase (AMP-forming)/AMP-acid ligase II